MFSDGDWREVTSDGGEWVFARENAWQDYQDDEHREVDLVIIRDMGAYTGDDDFHGRESGPLHIESGSLNLNEWGADAWLDDTRRDTILGFVSFTGDYSDDAILSPAVRQWFTDRYNRLAWDHATTQRDVSEEWARLDDLKGAARAWCDLQATPGWLAYEMNSYKGICDEPFQQWHTSLADAMRYMDIPQAALRDPDDYAYAPAGWGKECDYCYANIFPRERHARYAAADLADEIFNAAGATDELIARKRDHLARIIKRLQDAEHEDAPDWYHDGTPLRLWLNLTDERREEIAEAGYADAERRALAEAM